MLNRKTFENPPSKYRPMPFWFWNSRLRPEKVREQILDFKEKGLGGFFIHARFGLETEYLQKEWMDCTRLAVEVAAEQGLEVWLYDENGFPSGIGDLKVSSRQEFRPKYIMASDLVCGANGRIQAKLPAGEHVLAYAYSPEAPHIERMDILDELADGGVNWRAPSKDWKASVYTLCTLQDPNDVIFGVDYLDAAAMRYFFDIALRPYEEALSEHFGATIKGIFTDEPTLLPWHHDGDWYCQLESTRLVPWNNAIAEDMSARHNLSISEFLPHIFHDIDSATGHMRKLFQCSTVNVYMHAFFTPYKEWCQKNSLKLTGHFLLEEGLFYNTMFESDPYSLMSFFDVPGTDHLGDVTEHSYLDIPNLPVEHTNITGRKLASSAAHMEEKDTVISESFGCSGWSLTPERAKLMTDWQYSLGVNMLCPHAVFYSIEGFRKFDAPPAHNFLPSWHYYRTFADYVGRLSYALQQGRHRADVALYYPIKEFHRAYNPGVESSAARLISDSFDACCSVLPRLHIDYDIFSDTQLVGSKVQNGRLQMGSEEFSVLIAHSSCVRAGTRGLLEEFISGGGQVVIIATEPGFQALDGVTQIDVHGLSYPQIYSALRTLLLHQVSPGIKILTEDGAPAEQIRCHERVDREKHLYFLCNTEEQAERFSLLTGFDGQCELWCPESGQVTKVASSKAEDGLSRVNLELAPCQAVLLCINEAKPAVQVKDRPSKTQQVHVFADEWVFSTCAPNVLPLTEWKLQMQIQNSAHSMLYTTEFVCEHIPSNLKLMLDDIEYRSSLMGSMDLKINVNGTDIDNTEYGRYIEDGFKTVDISTAAVLGRNKITLAIAHSAWAGQPHFLNSVAYLVGDFSVAQGSGIYAPCEAAMCGSWTEFGYPYYSGAADYSQGFRVKRPARNTRLILCIDDVADMVEVLINDKPVQARLWKPWEVDITDHIPDRRGNLTLRVANSMANMIALEPKPSGLLGKVRLISKQA